MATKGNKKTNYEANEAFLQYEEEIVTHPHMRVCQIYAMMMAPFNGKHHQTEALVFFSFHMTNDINGG